MKKWIVLTTVLALSSTSLAQKIKVRRVKGNQAVVDFSGAALRPGQVYELTQDEFSEGYGTGSGNRKYSVGVSFSMINSKSDATGSVNETDLNMAARFGWNLGTLEVGPLFSYASDAAGAVTTTIIKFGGFADYNLISNVTGEPFVYGVGGTGSLGQHEGAGSAKVDVMDFFVGPFAKWFPNGGDTGLRIDAGYLYQRQSGGTTGDATVSGLGISGGLIAYF